ncbi:MAG: sensor histidine kinase [Bacteroidetes bacterium]|nr:MAG: sensor histidine kinase [Bacteroidota bacterium]
MRLLSKTTLNYFIFSGLTFVCGAFLFYHLLHQIFYKQIDENLREEKILIEETINHADTIPDFRSVFGHEILVTIMDKPLPSRMVIRDSVMVDSTRENPVRYRYLNAWNTSEKKKGYSIYIFKSLDETDSVITEIFIAFTFLFLALLVVLILVNYGVSRKVWIPFYKTIEKLREYDFRQQFSLGLSASKIREFSLLNQTLMVMAEKIRQDYLNLKEFNENAAHELQTPLAILKAKLDLLIEGEYLREEELILIRAMYDATLRASKLSQGLLLISKIDNNQFPTGEELDLALLIRQAQEHFQELMLHKEILCTQDLPVTFSYTMNRTLAEILINNLLSNAIKHNIPGGWIRISLNRSALVISNSGHVLSKDPMQLFGRFSKGEKSSESVGLGLSIVQKIASLYGMRCEYTYHEKTHTITIFF